MFCHWNASTFIMKQYIINNLRLHTKILRVALFERSSRIYLDSDLDKQNRKKIEMRIKMWCTPYIYIRICMFSISWFMAVIHHLLLAYTRGRIHARWTIFITELGIVVRKIKQTNYSLHMKNEISPVPSISTQENYRQL